MENNNPIVIDSNGGMNNSIISKYYNNIFNTMCPKLSFKEHLMSSLCDEEVKKHFDHLTVEHYYSEKKSSLTRIIIASVYYSIFCCFIPINHIGMALGISSVYSLGFYLGQKN
jgi:hypothetical protein